MKITAAYTDYTGSIILNKTLICSKIKCEMILNLNEAEYDIHSPYNTQIWVLKYTRICLKYNSTF